MRKALIVYRVNAEDVSSRGIYIKMNQQRDAILSYGIDCDMCYYTSTGVFVNDDCILKIDLKSTWNKIMVQLMFFYLVSKHIVKNYDVYYVRYAPLSLRLLSAFRTWKKPNAIIYLELPTYPYFMEYTGFKKVLVKILSYREKYFHKYIKAVLHLGTEKKLFKTPAIHFENGIHVQDYHPKKEMLLTNTLEILAVGSLWPWQGLERVLFGINEYKKRKDKLEIHLTIIGNGKERMTLVNLTKELGLMDEVTFVDALYGNALDEYFDRAHIAVGKLAMYKINLKYNKSLKHREYGARGIPFFYSGSDPSFDDKPYVLKFTDDGMPIDISRLVDFMISLQQTPTVYGQMRNDAEAEYSWKKQFWYLK